MTDDILTDRLKQQPKPPRRPLNWTAVTYNASIVSGIAMIGIGAGSRWGWQIGFVSAGALIIGLTLFAVSLRRRP